MLQSSRDSEVLTMEQTAEVLGVEVRTVRRWIAIRGLPYVKIGKEARVLRTSLMAWLKQQETVRTATAPEGE